MKVYTFECYSVVPGWTAVVVARDANTARAILSKLEPKLREDGYEGHILWSKPEETEIFQDGAAIVVPHG